ncbi:MAG: ATP-binding protein [Calditrichaeota bacterium]|nr:MAG: ATP-binding protein [Calditrichota bacterium]
MYYQRDIEKKLIASVESRKITVLLGPRQSGKTTLLKHLHQQIPSQTLYVDLDIFENQRNFAGYQEALRFLRFHGYSPEKRFVLFLDEFQGIAGIDRVLKNLYDHEPQLKIFATGSSSLAIVKRLRESLAGRKQIFHLYPLCFEEFIRFKEPALSEKLAVADMRQLPPTIREQLNHYVEEFCIFGGYPEVVLTSIRDEKIEILRSIFDLYVKKDLIGLLNIRNPDAAYNILRYLAINMGNPINYSDISTSQSIDINTLRHYLNILNETYLIKTITPFFTNKTKEIVRAPKAYFIDPGVRNYFLKNFVPLADRVDAGALGENFVFAQLLKKSDFLTEIKYWRDKNKREVDFVVEREQELRAYEVKYRHRISRNMIGGLLAFKRQYPQAHCYLVNIRSPNLNIPEINEREYFEI